MDLGIEGRVALVMGASRGSGAGSRPRWRGRAPGSRSPAARSSGSRRRPRRSARRRRRSSPTPPTRAARGAAGEVAAALGPVDILVANTGGPPLGGALDHELEEWEQAYRSLVLAPRVLAEAVVPGMRERGWGRIVNVGSNSTREPIPALNLSNAHRMAAVGFLKTLSREVAGDGITVNTVATGRFATERLAAHRRLARGRRSGRPHRSPRRPPRPAGGVRRPRRLPLLRPRRLHHRHRHPIDGGLLKS